MRAPFPPSPLSPLLPFLSPGRLVALALLLPSLALAQNPPPHALAGAADPAAPTAPIAYRGITPQPVNAQDAAPQDWRAAHTAVGTFPRGHADILAWEATQAGAAPSPTLSAPPSVQGDPLPAQRQHPMHPQHQGEHTP